MMISRSNSKISTIALILMLTISSVLAALPTVNATSVSTKQSYPYLGVIPNPVGVGQTVLLHVGITDQLQATEDGYENLTISIIDPDEAEITIGPLRTDATGGTGEVFTPDKVGTYTLQAHFPAQWYNYSGWTFAGFRDMATYFKAGTSEHLELVVQEEVIEYYPGNSLPEEYWTRPIDSQLREWSPIAGNWLTSGWDLPFNKLAPYNDGPESAHILWAKTLSTGGLVGGELGEHSYEIGDAYEGFFSESVIIAGVLYYNKYKAGFPTQEVVAVDLHTGKELWTKVLGDNERLSFGQTFYWDSYNYHGTFDYLWTTVGTTWNAYDALTGNWVYSITNVPSGTNIYGPKGEIYRYTVNLAKGWVTLWNSSSSRVVVDKGTWLGGMMGSGYKAYDGALGIEWNKTLPAGLHGSVLVTLKDRIIGATVDSWAGGTTGDPTLQLWGINLKAGHEGELLFNTTWARPTGNLTMIYKGASLEEGIFIISGKETTSHHAFSIDNGKLVWSTTKSQYYLDSLDYWTSASMHTALAYGKFISVGTGGIVYAYNAETGDLEWTYNADDDYQEILWSNNWPLLIAFITDGKIYLTHTEHSPIDPRPRGAPFICLDMEDGSEIWRIGGAFRGSYWGGRAIIGDSIIATYDTYDQQIYAIGKGPSATTVTASDTTQPLGTPILIKGTVMDVSPSTEDEALRMRFPNGVPAVADESMNEWMLYVYKQFQRPEDAKGVEVVFNWIDEDGVWHDLDRTTTDMSGTYSYMWAPEAEGKYTIVATFMGSEGYYASYAETAVGVGPAAEEYPDVPSAEEIAEETISQLPAYPDVPTAEEIAADAAQRTINMLPAYPEIPEIPAYLTIDLAIIAAVAIAVIIGIVSYLALKKQK